jgi:hypothetical protein
MSHQLQRGFLIKQKMIRLKTDILTNRSSHAARSGKLIER